jgi:4-amino-4-deoxy-L-arabinose transferase-like glycosyltransferase
MKLTGNGRVAIFFLTLVFISKFPTIHYPYHWDAINNIHGALYILLHNLIPRLGQYDLGHPPLFHILLAITWTLCGMAPWVSHSLVIFFSFLGVFFTYLCGARLKNQSVGIIAALLLFCSPLYFAQSGIANLEIPSVAFIMMTAYAALTQRTFLYIMASSCAVLSKEPALLFILVILLQTICYFQSIKLFRKKVTVTIIPLILFSIWLFWHRWIEGWWFYPHSGYTYSVHSTITKIFLLMQQLFIDEFNFLIFAFIVVYIFGTKVNKRKNSIFLYIILFLAVLVVILFKKPLLLQLSSLVLLSYICVAFIRINKDWFIPLVFINLSLVAFSLYNGFLPRYLIIAYPFFYLIGAYSIVSLLEGKKSLINFVLAIVLLLFISRWYLGRTFASTGSGALLESNMDYLDVVKVHMKVCKFIEQEYPRATILTAWPLNHYLQEPNLGYVSRQMNVLLYRTYMNKLPLSVDVICIPTQGHETAEMNAFCRLINVRLLKHFCEGCASAAVYVIKK